MIPFLNSKKLVNPNNLMSKKRVYECLYHNNIYDICTHIYINFCTLFLPALSHTLFNFFTKLKISLHLTQAFQHTISIHVKTRTILVFPQGISINLSLIKVNMLLSFNYTGTQKSTFWKNENSLLSLNKWYVANHADLICFMMSSGSYVGQLNHQSNKKLVNCITKNIT